MDMEHSKVSYSQLGFELVMSESFEHNGDARHCCMIKRGNMLMEFYLMPPGELDAIHRRGNGYIDHVVFNEIGPDGERLEFNQMD